MASRRTTMRGAYVRGRRKMAVQAQPFVPNSDSWLARPALGTPRYATDNSIGSTIEGSSFSGLLTRVEISHCLSCSAARVF
jgi:hypothetical protein